MWRFLVVLVVACSSAEPDPPAPTPAKPPPEPQYDHPPPPPPPPQAPHARMHATWSKISTVSDCWYFSGPDGRDTKLAGDAEVTRDGEHVTLTIGGATFTGTYIGTELSLSRKTTHTFDDPWTVAETIKGTYHEGAIEAKYRYTECESGTRCPNRCTIAAELRISR